MGFRHAGQHRTKPAQLWRHGDPHILVDQEHPDGDGPRVAAIAHVALSQPFDYFDEAALFYRSVLGLELHAGDELASPEGLVRSRAARSADGSVRFALSVPVVGNGASERQHVALAATTSSRPRA